MINMAVGCGKMTTEEAIKQSGEEQEEITKQAVTETEIPATEAAPGKLIRIKYAVSSGTAYGCDFSIDVTPQQIVSARFFSEEQMDYVLLEQEPLEEAQWKELERTVSELLPVLEEATSGVSKPSEVSPARPLPCSWS